MDFMEWVATAEMLRNEAEPFKPLSTRNPTGDAVPHEVVGQS